MIVGNVAVVRRERERKRMGRLSELKFLNNLRGLLVILGLSNARDAEAMEADLGGKQYLECLRLYWGTTPEATQEGEEALVSVMESLQPHPNLKELFIPGYGGVRFPYWMMMNDGLDLLLPNLIRIDIYKCKRCQVLPPFGQLPYLQYLHLWNLDVVEYMQEDYPLSAKPFFPSLKTLAIELAQAQQAPSCPYLERLILGNITRELCLHFISLFSSPLKSLEISGIEDLISLSDVLQHLSILQNLEIEYCSDLATLPDMPSHFQLSQINITPRRDAILLQSTHTRN